MLFFIRTLQLKWGMFWIVQRGGGGGGFGFFFYPATIQNNAGEHCKPMSKLKHLQMQAFKSPSYWGELKTSTMKVKMYFHCNGFCHCPHCDHEQGQAETRLAIPVLWTFGAENHQRPQNVFGKCFINSTVSQHSNIKLKIIVCSTSSLEVPKAIMKCEASLHKTRFVQ